MLFRLAVILFLFAGISIEAKKNFKVDVDGPLEEISKNEKEFSFVLKARRFAPGEVIFLKISTKNKTDSSSDHLKLFWNSEEYSLIRSGNDLISFLPVNPETAPGPVILEIISRKWFIRKSSKKYEIEIEKPLFVEEKMQKIELPKKYSGEYPKETLEFIRNCESIKAEAFKTDSPFSQEGNFEFPVKEKKISSPFYIRRNYNNRKGRPHGGVDFRGSQGVSIFAMQSGKVLIARPMYFEGIFTVIDHGSKIFSFYMHQSQTLVKEGDVVEKGTIIGKIGSTGMSTGPHLHVGMKIRGIAVDPLSVLALRVF